MENAQIARDLVNINFPLKDTYIFCLACESCFTKISEGPKGFHLKQPCSNCGKNKLVVKKKEGTFWTEIRSRPACIKRCHITYNTCYDYKKYKACINKPCTFPHGEAELHIWNLEQTQEFNTDDFITVLKRHNIGTSELLEQKKKLKFLPGLTTSTDTTSNIIQSEFLDKHSSEATENRINSIRLKDNTKYEIDPALELFDEPEHFENYPHPLYNSHFYKHFCTDCFSKPLSVSQHRCDKTILAFAKKGTRNWLIVRDRFRFISTGYQVCVSVENKDKPCDKGQACPFAHNNVEKYLWNLEKDKKFYINSLTSKERIISFRFVTDKYGFDFDFICKICFKNNYDCGQNLKNTLYCNSGHLWENSKILQYSVDRTLIRRPSSVINNYKLCYSRNCNDANCIYAHSMVERDVWMVLRDQNITLEYFVSYCKSAKYKVPHMLNEFCTMCYNTGRMLTHSECRHDKMHGSIYFTKTSRKKINPLPRTIPSKYNFQICDHMKNYKCTKTLQVECSFAHSSEEIDIWKWMCHKKVKSLEEYVNLQNQFSSNGKVDNSLKLNETKVTRNIDRPSVSQEKFKNQGSYSSIVNHCSNANKQSTPRENPKLHQNINGINGNTSHALQEPEKMQNSSENQAKLIPVECYNSVDVPLCENHPDIQITLNTNSVYSPENKDYLPQWCFDIFSLKHNLWKIIILTNNEVGHFFLMPTAQNNISQSTPASMFNIDEHKWKVPILYIGDACKTFSMKVVFDFSIQNLLFCPIDVNFSATENGKDLKNSQMTSLKTFTNTQFNYIELDDLTNVYKIPEKLVFNEDVTEEFKLNKDNYIETMHTLLYVEENTRKNMISSYNFESEMKISNLVNDKNGTMFTALLGELFGIIDFSTSLLHKDPENLILKNCDMVLLSLKSDKDKFHEIPITKKEECQFKGLHEKTLYLTFDKELVSDLKLENGKSVHVEIHFKLNRMPFLKMHQALDYLKYVEIVFPSSYTIPLEHENQDYSDTHLNKDQVDAIKCIPSKCTNSRPPFVIIGSFGTGKTETLLCAITKVVEQNSVAKILICTYTNKAADLLIIKHLHKFLCRNKKTPYLKRLYYKERRLETIDPLIHKYIISPEELKSVLSDSQSMQILVTTMEMCYSLMALNIQGYFSHIFIDEAARAFESMVLLPLTLASEKTCLVLCGDPNQIGPEVHSTNIAKELLSTSIVKRLYDYYKKQKKKITLNPPFVLLKQNYRSCKEIVNFLAYTFYGLSHEMTSNVENPVSDMKALQFYSVEGSTETTPNNLSYYNAMEIEEIKNIVQNVMKFWSDNEEQLKLNEICIISNEQNQVLQLRKYLKYLNIENVDNVHGKEFKVVIISTVHTTSSVLINGVESCRTNFLNNRLLLNTAMSRAKYVVIVVGDPVALCISGECKYIWQNFIQNCSELKTLHPADITYDVIHSKVIKQLNDISQEEYEYVDETAVESNIYECVKHCENPEECFPLLCTKTAGNLKSASIIDAIYKEALHVALTVPAVMFPDINIKWDHIKGCGEFCIKSSALKACNIEFHSADSMNPVPDWLCIQYEDCQSSAEAETHYIHVWITDVKNEYENQVVKLQVIESEIALLKQITGHLSCTLWLISLNYYYRFLINSLINTDTISSLIEIYVNEFNKIPNGSDKEFIPNMEILRYESPTSGDRIGNLTKWLKAVSIDIMASGKYQIIVCSKEESTLDALEHQLKLQETLSKSIIRVADEETEETYLEAYFESTITIDSQDDLTYLHECLLKKNELFQNYMKSMKAIRLSGLNIPLETKAFKEKLLVDTPIIFCNIMTTTRVLFKNLNKKKMIVIADAANHKELLILLPLLLNNIQNVFLFTEP